MVAKKGLSSQGQSEQGLAEVREVVTGGPCGELVGPSTCWNMLVGSSRQSGGHCN